MKKFISFLLSLTILISMVSISGVYASEEKEPTYDNQEILKEVALSFYRQGPQMLYDQLVLRRNIYASPEDATAQRTIYLDCSSFVNACYREAFGVNILPVEISATGKIPQTRNFKNYAKENPDAVDVIGYWENKDYPTYEEEKALLDSVRAQLQIGDVLCFMRGKTSETSGHVYIYMGDDTFIHSTGAGSYTENTEYPSKSYDDSPGELADGTVGLVPASRIFTDTSDTRYLFKKTASQTVFSFCLLRPMERGLTPTEETLNRMKIAGLAMEKTSSIHENTAVYTDDVITYTITLENTNQTELKDVEIRDTLPLGTKFVSGSEGVTANGRELTWKGNVSGNATATVSYSVAVTAAEPGTLLKSDATFVSGVKLGNITHCVSGYSKAHTSMLGENAMKLVKEGKAFANSLEMITTLYKDTLGINLFENLSEAQILDEIIDTENLTAYTQTALSKMIAPNLYGGTSIGDGWRYRPDSNDRTRLVSENQLTVGDIIIADYSGGSIAYVYAGNSTLVTVEDGKAKKLTIGKNIYGKEANNILVTLISYNRFAVIRPSMANTSSVVPVISENNDVKVTINDITRQFDVMPIIENGRVLVPMRAIFETLGATVLWDEAERTVTATKKETSIVLPVGKETAKVNDTEATLDAPAKIVDGRTLVPIRFVAEALGCRVDWDNDARTVIIQKDSEVHFPAESLDGKKVLVIGNDLLHYGRIVDSLGKAILTREERQDTKCGLVQLCKANGMNVSVTNWAISSHNLMDLVGNEECSVCKKGVIHKDYLADKYFDYILVSPAASKAQAETLISDMEYIESTFKEANPNVKILILGNIGAYGNISTGFEPTEIAALYTTLDSKGFKVLDFGKLVTDVILGKTEVPGSNEVFSHNTFIIKDGQRPNLLTGYISTLLAYCTITGESAVGQPYLYVHDTSLAPTFDIPGCLTGFYTHGGNTTNFDEIFESEYEVECIQKLVDQYLGR